MAGAPARTEVHPGTPHPALAPYVKRYTGFLERSDGPLRRRELPFGGTAVILSLESDWLLGVTEDAPLQRFGSFVGGIIDRPAISEHAGFAHALQFDLTPLGSIAVLGVPGAELAGRIVGFEEIVGRDGTRLVEELVHESGWAGRFALLDGWLRARVAEETVRRELRPDVAWAWRRLVATNGAVGIGTLLDELGCSRRHLAARFREDIGITPKAFGRLVRFELATERLRHTGEELGVIAVEVGYYDQAHFNRDVKQFAGVAPGTLMRERHAGGFVF